MRHQESVNELSLMRCKAVGQSRIGAAVRTGFALWIADELDRQLAVAVAGSPPISSPLNGVSLAARGSPSSDTALMARNAASE
jgi:hypothetical protein